MMDINCDLGEGLPNDAALMPLLNSCNIACGGHAGDAKSIEKTILLAQKYGVKIGAHPSYPDPENFGRKVMDIAMESLRGSLIEQIDLFYSVAKAYQVPVHHIKAHGALYNEAAKNAALAAMLIDIVLSYYPDVTLYAPPNSLLASQAENMGISVMLEVFGDRTYENDFQLVSRTHPEALITDLSKAKRHIDYLFEGKIYTLHGEILPIQGDTLCIHGDNPSALPILQMIQQYGIDS